MSQHVAVAKRVQHAATNSVPICCFEMLLFFQKPQPNDRNISTQHIPTLLAQHLQAPVKRSQHFSTAYRNIVGRNMLHAFDHPTATCCDMLGIENGTSVHAQAQDCCKNLDKRLQHHATSKNVEQYLIALR